MIHNVKLPLQTTYRLSQIVQLQLDLLRYATEPDAQIDYAKESNTQIDREKLATYLESFPHYKDRGQTIARYIVGTQNQQGKFGSLLKKIIEGQEGAEVWGQEIREDKLRAEKRHVIDLMEEDILKLALEKTNDTFSFYLLTNEIPPAFTACNYHIANTTAKVKYPNWLQAVRTFLQEFYKSLGEGLSAKLFPDNTQYSRQDYFQAFVEENKGQYVCVICDETSFRTITQKSDHSIHFHSDIEHYFPQSVYPHLACHPYNLIPICKFCNQALHGDKDPLNNNSLRRKLKDVFLPYRLGGLAESGVLRVNLDNDSPSFQLVNHIDTTNLGEKLKALSDIYDIPGRWQQKQDEIGDHLWRRLRSFLADDIQIADVFDSPDHIQRKLNRLLAYIHDDLGRDPLSFPTLWWLASLIELETQQDTKSAFLQEIQSWLKHDQSRKEELDKLATKLRERVVIVYQQIQA